MKMTVDQYKEVTSVKLDRDAVHLIEADIMHRLIEAGFVYGDLDKEGVAFTMQGLLGLFNLLSLFAKGPVSDHVIHGDVIKFALDIVAPEAATALKLLVAGKTEADLPSLEDFDDA